MTTRKKIKSLLAKALLRDGKMERALYEFELAEEISFFRNSLKADNDDYLFVVTENQGEVAMLLLEKSGELHINEAARQKLKEVWKLNYENNLRLLIPGFAQQLSEGEFPTTGVKVVDRGEK